MRLKELVDLQLRYSILERNIMTKKALCDLIIPFRDKYALTDGQALSVARRELPLYQIEKLTRNKVYTNADRIRAMSDEKLAWEMMTWRIKTEAKHHGVESNFPNTKKKILEWLQQPAEVTNG